MSASFLRAAVTLLVLAVAGQRLAEVQTSRRNERALLRRGAREHARGQMPVMAALHAAWLVSTLVEIWALDRAPTFVAVPALALLGLGQWLRRTAMRELGGRWTVKVLTIPGAPAVRTGIFRHLRHPNYLGVVLEIAALPLVGGAVVTAVVFSILNALLLSARVAAEEAALRADADYELRMGSRPRFVPRWDMPVGEP